VTGDETEPEQIQAYLKFQGIWLKRETPIYHWRNALTAFLPYLCRVSHDTAT
jgi:hypothetical protein